MDSNLKLRCDSRFQRAFTACSGVFKVITLIGSNQGNYFEKLYRAFVLFTSSLKLGSSLLPMPTQTF